MQAIQALVDVDISFAMDRLHHAFIGTTLTGSAAFLVALQPLKHTQTARYSQGCTQGTQVTAIETFDKQSRRQYCYGKQHKRPLADKVENNAGLKGFYLGQPFCQDQ